MNFKSIDEIYQEWWTNITKSRPEVRLGISLEQKIEMRRAFYSGFAAFHHALIQCQEIGDPKVTTNRLNNLANEVIHYFKVDIHKENEALKKARKRHDN